MRTGRLDAAVISVGETVPEGLASVVVDDQPLVAAVAPGHELAVHTRVPLAALRGHALISLPGGTGLRARLDEALRGGRLHPPDRVRGRRSGGSRRTRGPRAGVGVAILPAVVAAARPDRLRRVALTRPDLRGRLVFAWRAGGPAGPAGRALAGRARAALRSSGR
ncbi:hypothetical protein BEN35_07660 [Streptomyces fradiae]|nr:hypothetical protein BEN35_07660 [Streptomyces fradiae]